MVSDLRDQIAVQALCSLIERTPSHLAIPKAKLAQEAYEFADAMLKQRSKTQS